MVAYSCFVSVISDGRRPEKLVASAWRVSIEFSYKGQGNIKIAGST